MSQWGPYPLETETQRREREEAEDRKGEHEMEYRRETVNEEWKLTREEIQDIITSGYIKHNSLGVPGCRQAIDDDIATAAQRKLLRLSDFTWSSCPEWSSSMCRHFSGDDACACCWAAYRLASDFQSMRAALSPHQEAGK